MKPGFRSSSIVRQLARALAAPALTRSQSQSRGLSRRVVLKGIVGTAVGMLVAHGTGGKSSLLRPTVASASTSVPAIGGYRPELRRYPYLTDVVETYATINWATDRSQTTGSVLWGQELSDGSYTLDRVSTATRTSITVNSIPVYQWKVQLEGLAPDTVYRYRIILGSNPGIDLLGTDQSPRFHSQMAAGDNRPLSFAVFGDWASVYEADGTHPAQANLMARVAESGARFAVTTGDNGNHSGSQNNYGDLYVTGPSISGTFGPAFWARPGSSIPIFPTIGNHGFNSSSTHHPHLLNWPQDRAVAGSGGRYARATYCCLNGTAATDYPQTWYAFTAANVRFYLLQSTWHDQNPGSADSYKNDYDYHWTPSSEQYQWLKSDLERHPSQIKLAFFHFPMYSDGKPTSDVYLRGAESLEGLLANYGVHIAFNGHTHMYQRNLKPAGGVISYVTGGGGARLGPVSSGGCATTTAYALGWSYSSNDGAGKGSACGGAPLPASPDEVHHFLLVSVDGTVVTVTPINSLGSAFDAVTYDFGAVPGPDTEAPGVPANLVGQAAGTSQVDLSWTAATDNVGVVEYRLHRDGSQLFSLGGDVTTCSDTGLAASTSYTYEVYAVDAAGNVSQPSNPVTVTTPAEPPPPEPTQMVFSDGFESGDLSRWTSATGFAVQQQSLYSGAYAARSTTSNAVAVAYKHLEQDYAELYLRLRFNAVASDKTKTTYLQQFRTADGTSLLGLYISGSGRLGYRNVVSGKNVTSSIIVSEGVWHEAQIRLLVAGTQSQTEVWYDGVRVDALSQTEAVGETGIGRIQLGESAARTLDIVIDDMIVDTGFIAPTVEA